MCPGCGVRFVGSTLWCTPECCKRARKVVRGLRLSTLPPAEREMLAEMIAFMRAGYRRIDQWRKGRDDLGHSGGPIGDAV
jgi:hypothetical protein